MNSVTIVRRLHQHRMWSNQRLLDSAKRLTKEELCRSFPIGQGSVWKSLTHLMAAEYVWLEALLGDEQPVMPGDRPDMLPGNQSARGHMASLDD